MIDHWPFATSRDQLFVALMRWVHRPNRMVSAAEAHGSAGGIAAFITRAVFVGCCKITAWPRPLRMNGAGGLAADCAT